MSKKEEIDLLIERAYEACQFDELQTYVNQLEKRVMRLEKNLQEEPQELLWPSLTRHID